MEALLHRHPDRRNADLGSPEKRAHSASKDRKAFTTSLLLKMMSIWEKPTEIEAKIMADVLDSIQSIRQSDLSKDIAAGL